MGSCTSQHKVIISEAPAQQNRQTLPADSKVSTYINNKVENNLGHEHTLPSKDYNNLQPGDSQEQNISEVKTPNQDHQNSKDSELQNKDVSESGRVEKLNGKMFSVSNKEASLETDPIVNKTEDTPDNADASKDESEKKDDTKGSGSEGEGEEAKVPLTEAEIQDLHNESVDTVKQKIEIIQNAGSTFDEDGEVRVEIRNSLLIFYRAYFHSKRVPLLPKQYHRKEMAKLLVNANIPELIHSVISHSYKTGYRNPEDGKPISKKWNPFMYSMIILNNFTDCSEEFCVAVCKTPGFLETLREFLVLELEPHFSETRKESSYEEKFLRWVLGTIHNITMQDSCVSYLRQLDFTSALVPYLKSHLEYNSLNSLAALAGIIDEKESDIINANKDMVLILLERLRAGLKMKLRRHNGWSCKECATVIRLLARNDANKRVLVELGSLELLVKLGTTAKDNAERMESVSAIWALAFDEENRKTMVDNEDLGIIELLLQLKHSDDHEVKKTCNGALWTLREELQQSTKYKDTGNVVDSPARKARAKSAKKGESDKKKKKKVDNSGHIMISYQWANQPLLITIRDRLKEAGHKVWLDIDQMGGSTLQSMADAVEDAKIVLMCMTQKYKNSPNCRAEAEYAFQRQKIIVPLKLERGYNPDGWLGFICGAKLFHEFSEKYPFEMKMTGLLKELDSILRRTGGQEEVDAPPQQGHHPPSVVTVQNEEPQTASVTQSVVMATPPSHMTTHVTSHVTDVTIETIRGWTAQDVQKWIEKNHLKSCGLDKLTGGEIALLITMRVESPDFFYKCLETMLKAKDLLTLSKIVWALKDLTKEMG